MVSIRVLVAYQQAKAVHRPQSVLSLFSLLWGLDVLAGDSIAKVGVLRVLRPNPESVS